jgi:opacity protein-like surface antigen
MKKFLLLGMLTPLFVQAQWHVNLFGGFANYFGDLQSKAYTTQQSHGAVGAGLQYDLNQHVSLLTNLTYGKVGASDAYNTKADLIARNLSFQTNILEWNVLAEYNLLNLKKHRFSPYIFAGVGLYHFNPYANDTLGRKVYLKPLSTEGEGLPQYPGQKPYQLTQFSIPFGGGIKFRVSDNVVLAYEIGLRKLFTDYLDDVSTRYVDQATLLAAKGPEAVEMAYRGNEVKQGSAPYPPDGQVRGNSKHLDWYYFSGIRVIIALNTNSWGPNKGGHGGLDCPKKVY